MLEAQILHHFKRTDVYQYLEEDAVVEELQSLQNRKVLTAEALAAICLENGSYWPTLVEQSIMSRENEDAPELAFKIGKIFSAVKKLILPMPRGYEMSPQVVLQVLDDKINNRLPDMATDTTKSYIKNIKQ